MSTRARKDAATLHTEADLRRLVALADGIQLRLALESLRKIDVS